MEDRKGKVAQGTCGWSDTTILKCGRFYPPFVKTCEDKLRHYSQFFPCVECDSSNYAIPSPFKIEKWLNCVPKNFLFHFKAYGLFTRKYAPWNSIPNLARKKLRELGHNLPNSSNASYDALPVAMKDYIWELFNAAVEPAYKKNKLGVIVFQFPLNFQPCSDSREHVEHCREKLSNRYKMVVEFRSRVWLSAANLEQTLQWLKKLQIGLVVTDDLADELYMGQKPPTIQPVEGDIPNANPRVVPIVMALADPTCCYIRVHRREGNKRILSEDEITSWASRLSQSRIQEEIEGPIYFMWGTDHEDQPIINSKNLTKQLGDLTVTWKPENKSSLINFCTPVKQAKGLKRDSFGNPKSDNQINENNTEGGTDCTKVEIEEPVSKMAKEELEETKADEFTSVRQDEKPENGHRLSDYGGVSYTDGRIPSTPGKLVSAASTPRKEVTGSPRTPSTKNTPVREKVGSSSVKKKGSTRRSILKKITHKDNEGSQKTLMSFFKKK